MKLGWRHPRPNDFQTFDQRPLRDTFGDLQHFMSWPHFRLERHALQVVATGVTYAVVWDTQVEDPNDLWRSGAVVDVPTEFDSYWFVGSANSRSVPAAAAERRVLGIYLNGLLDPGGSGHSAFVNSIANPCRLNPSVQVGVKRGDQLEVRYTNNSASSDDLTDVWFGGYFLPRV